MKKLIIPILLIIIFGSSNSNSQSLKLGFSIGLSTPNEMMNNIYNADKSTIDSVGIVNLLRDDTKYGYHIALKGRLKLSDNFLFFGGLAYHKFQATEIKVPDPKDETKILTKLNVSETIIPISAGMNFYLFKNVIGLYGVGQIDYNYLTNTVEVQNNSVNWSLPTTPTDSRVGFGVGAGLDFDLKLLLINTEFRYNMVNLIGQTANEKPKEYYTLSFGVFF